MRHDAVVLSDITVTPEESSHSAEQTRHLADLDGDAFELSVSVDRPETERKRFGLQLFADEDDPGLEIMIRPETSTIRVGMTEAPFAVADLPEGEDIQLRIFVDKYLVEVFANERQSLVAAHMNYQVASGLRAYTYGGPTRIRKVEIWKMKAINQGIIEARERRIWEPQHS